MSASRQRNFESITAEVGSWQKQETRKGIDSITGTRDGGWGFYCWQESVGGETVMRNYSATEANAMVADGSVTNNPVFNRGYGPMLAASATPDEVMYALAKYVPAVSSAVGGLALRDDTVTSIDLNGTSLRNGWGRNHCSAGTAPREVMLFLTRRFWCWGDAEKR